MYFTTFAFTRAKLIYMYRNKCIALYFPAQAGNGSGMAQCSTWPGLSVFPRASGEWKASLSAVVAPVAAVFPHASGEWKMGLPTRSCDAILCISPRRRGVEESKCFILNRLPLVHFPTQTRNGGRQLFSSTDYNEPLY